MRQLQKSLTLTAANEVAIDLTHKGESK